MKCWEEQNGGSLELGGHCLQCTWGGGHSPAGCIDLRRVFSRKHGHGEGIRPWFLHQKGFKGPSPGCQVPVSHPKGLGTIPSI